VNLQAEAVAGSCEECVAEPGRGNDLTARSVHVVHGRAWDGRGDSRRLSGAHHVKYRLIRDRDVEQHIAVSAEGVMTGRVMRNG
jgi:hypothetical protein